jgi:hypothetical protein
MHGINDPSVFLRRRMLIIAEVRGGTACEGPDPRGIRPEEDTDSDDIQLGQRAVPSG